MSAKVPKRSDKLLKGYWMVYRPDHPKCMKNKNWYGYVKKHLLVAEEMIGRPLRDDEIVHHLDGDTTNNNPINLLVILNSMHSKLHAWFARGAPGIERFGVKRVELITARARKKRGECVICNKPLVGNQRKYCSNACKGLALRRTKRPNKDVLKKDVQKMSWCAMGRKYGVSDNAVRRWAKDYGLL
jgi:hypothetical protein